MKLEIGLVLIDACVWLVREGFRSIQGLM